MATVTIPVEDLRAILSRTNITKYEHDDPIFDIWKRCVALLNGATDDRDDLLTLIRALAETHDTLACGCRAAKPCHYLAEVRALGITIPD